MIDTTPPIRDDAVEQQSVQLQELYRQLAEDQAALEANAEVKQLTEEESRFAASQWGMIWRRFRRNKAAIVGGIIVLIYYVVALAGNFVAPYSLTNRYTD